MGQQLQTVLPVRSQDSKEQEEPAIDESKETEAAKDSRGELMAAASLFNKASSQDTEEQQAVEDALRDAMSSPSHLEAPEREMQSNVAAACLPDYAKCPKEWIQKGVLCFAPSDYNGVCSLEADLSEMNLEQKQAFANICNVEFPCQEDCPQDFSETCPSLWREIANGVCSAPAQYEGPCSVRLSVASMSEEDKYAFSIRCGARWQCAGTKKRNYQDICPLGWSLQFGKICTAPLAYNGPCEHTAYMQGASVQDKKRFEANCGVSWPSNRGTCTHDYAAPCPYGWLARKDCIAPPTYQTCSRIQKFSGMGPADKEDWAKTCKVEFPCKDRSTCEKLYSAPCPANWYTFNGGLSCAAPNNYGGTCLLVMHGLLDLSVSEKVDLESKCEIEWPCMGEVFASQMEARVGDHLQPRTSYDPATYAGENGAIDSSSGTIVSQGVM